MDPASERLAGTAFGRLQVLPHRRELLAAAPVATSVLKISLAVPAMVAEAVGSPEHRVNLT
jgi:hypothetical protein